MDASVIEEIANQLGMAVDQAGMFITEHLPEFAALKVVQATTPVVIGWGIVAILAIITVVSFVIFYKAYTKQEYAMPGDFVSAYIWSCSLAVLVIVVFIVILITGNCVPDIIGWSNYPEAMLIDMALKAV